jgi:hypothetical protein
MEVQQTKLRLLGITKSGIVWAIGVVQDVEKFVAHRAIAGEASALAMLAAPKQKGVRHDL